MLKAPVKVAVKKAVKKVAPKATPKACENCAKLTADLAVVSGKLQALKAKCLKKGKNAWLRELGI